MDSLCDPHPVMSLLLNVNELLFLFYGLSVCKRFLVFKLYLPPANEVCEGYVFTPVCQSFCSQRGCMAGGACVAGDMCGRGACVAGGCAWARGCVHGRVCVCGQGGMCGRGACMAGDMHGQGGCAWQGGMHATHTPPDTTRYGQSMRRRYASTGMHSCFVFKLHYAALSTSNWIHKQVCIPVGCTPTACWPYCVVSKWRRGVCLLRGGGLNRGVSAQGSVCLGEGCIPACSGADNPPWTESQTGVKTLKHYLAPNFICGR